jgi:hypothetical protein
MSIQKYGNFSTHRIFTKIMLIKPNSADLSKKSPKSSPLSIQFQNFKSDMGSMRIKKIKDHLGNLI